MVPEVIAALALGTSIVALVRETKSDWRSRRVEQTQIELQRRMTAIEEARRGEEVRLTRMARIVATVERRAKHTKTQECLVLRNTGSATARNVTFDPALVPDGGLIGADELPIKNLPPETEYSFLLALSFGSARSFEVTIHWEDESGNQEQMFSLSLPP